VWKEADEREPTVGETGAPPAQDQRPPPIDHRLPLTCPHHAAAVVETWQELSTRWAGILHSGWLSHAGTVPGRHTETRKRARYRSPSVVECARSVRGAVSCSPPAAPYPARCCSPPWTRRGSAWGAPAPARRARCLPRRFGRLPRPIDPKRRRRDAEGRRLPVPPSQLSGSTGSLLASRDQ
jgi:hypothetical protein